MACYAFEAMVNFFTSALYCFCVPGDEMVFEDPFMKLVVNIGGEALEDITLR